MGGRTLLAIAERVCRDTEQRAVGGTHRASSSRCSEAFCALIRTRIRKLGACQRLVVKDALGEEAKKTTFYLSRLLEANAQEMVHHLAVRWERETFFGDFKELLGSDHYQRMSDRAIVRFWTLCCLASLFLDEQRVRHKEHSPTVKSPDLSPQRRRSTL